ncbi:MAG TPA: MTH1187 family thiamine-binding protein [bacterium]
MLAELEVLPVGTGTASLSVHLARVAKLIDSSGLDYRVGPMGTVVEGDWDAIMALAAKCRAAALEIADRVILSIRIDDRKDKSGPRMEQKVRALEAAAGLTFKR